MIDMGKVISTFEKIIRICKEDGCDFVDLTFEDAEQILAMLKEQETVEHALEVLRKAGWKETQDVPFPAELLKEQDAVEGHWIVLGFCANEGIYCSKCMNKIFDRSTKPKKKLSNYCPNCGSKNTHFFNPSTEKIMYSD